MSDLERDTVQLVGLALQGKSADVAALGRRVLRAVARKRPDLESMIQGVTAAAAASVTRAMEMPLPVDLDSRLELLRREQTPSLPVEPTWPEAVRVELEMVIQERHHEEKLEQEGVAPTKSLLFVGPPGVGKTLAARWLALQLERPLLTLDLSAVMSSFLGRTGNNIRVVLDYARQRPAVLLLDEFDAIAKRRDDATEVGELKRLVTVLLQSVDDWPTSGLLIAATNHPDLLDPAVWRRFDRVIEFPEPNASEIATSIARLVGDGHDVTDRLDLLSALLMGRSFADVSRIVTTARRNSIVRDIPLTDALERTIAELSRSADQVTKLRVAADLAATGRSQRDVSSMTGLSRDTIRKHLGPTIGKIRKTGRHGREAQD